MRTLIVLLSLLSLLSLFLAIPLYAADVLVAPGDPIPGNVEGIVTLLPGQHTTSTTVEITESMTLTAKPGAVWTSSADPAIAVHANDVTISNLVLVSANPTATAIVSGSPVTLVKPSHRVSVISNKIEGFASGVFNVYGDWFVVKNNEIIGTDVALDPLWNDTVGVLNTMGSNAIIEKNLISGFQDGIFGSGHHGRIEGNRIRRTCLGITFCSWFYPVAGEPDFYPDLVPVNAPTYWNIHNNTITDGIRIPGYYFDLPPWGIEIQNDSHHNLVSNNRINGYAVNIILLGEASPWVDNLGDIALRPAAHENIIIARPEEVVENWGNDPVPTYGNVIVGSGSMDAQERALYNDVRLNAGPPKGKAAPPIQSVKTQSTTWGDIKLQ